MPAISSATTSKYHLGISHRGGFIIANLKSMKKIGYSSPRLDICEVEVERGYQSSVDYDFTIDGWSEGDSFDGKGE